MKAERSTAVRLAEAERMLEAGTHARYWQAVVRRLRFFRDGGNVVSPEYHQLLIDEQLETKLRQ